MRGSVPSIAVWVLRCHPPCPTPHHPTHPSKNQDLTEEDLAFKAKQKADAAAMKKAAEALKSKKK